MMKTHFSTACSFEIWSKFFCVIIIGSLQAKKMFWFWYKSLSYVTYKKFLIHTFNFSKNQKVFNINIQGIDTFKKLIQRFLAWIKSERKFKFESVRSKKFFLFVCPKIEFSNEFKVFLVRTVRVSGVGGKSMKSFTAAAFGFETF